MTIKSKLILSFLTIAIVPVLLVESWTIYQSEKALEVARIAGLETIADLKVDKIETFFIEREADIKAAQHYFNIKTHLPTLTRLANDRSHPDYIEAKKSLDRQLKPFTLISGYIDVMLVNPEGDIVYVTNDEHAKFDLDHTLPDHDGRAFEEGRKGIYFSKIFVNDVADISYGMLVTAPLIDLQGRFSGVIALEVDMAAIYQFIQDTTGLGQTGETLIATKVDGAVLFLNPLRHDEDASFKRKVAIGSHSAFPIQEAVLGRKGAGLSIDYRKEKIIAAWRYIPTLNWGLVAKIDEKEAFASVTQLKRQIFMFAGIVLFLVTSLGVAFASSIAKPILALQKGMEIVGAGNLDYKVGTDAQDEIGQLSRVFVKMTESLANISSAREALTMDLKKTNQSLQQEIRDREKAETEARKSEATINSILETAADAIITIGESELVKTFNHAAEGIFGYTPDEIIGQNISILMSERHLLRYMKSGESMIGDASRETLGKRKDGLIFPIDLSVSKVDLNHRQIFTLIVRDITWRKQVKKEQRLAAIVFDACTEAITITDTQGNILSVNPAFSLITGYSAEEVIGKNPKILQSGRYDSAFYKSMWDKIAVTGHWQGEIWNRRKDGSVYEETLSISAVRDKQEKVTHYIAMFSDISEQKRAAKKLNRLNHDLKSANSKLSDEMSERERIETELRLAQKLEAVGQLAAGIAHEINTPMQYLGDNVHFLKTAFEDYSELVGKYKQVCLALKQFPGQEAVLDEVKEAEDLADLPYLEEHLPQSFERTFEGIERVSEIVKAMKDFSHPDQREKAVTDLNKGIANTLTVAKNEYKYVADVETAFGELPPVMCHVGEINQVFLNLIVNAAHAIGGVVKDTQEKGQIHIRTEMENENTVLITVRDTGGGIPEKIRDRVFDPFFTTKEVGRGTGQGLAISRSAVVDKHGGSLSLESETGEGTTFFVRLPIDGKAIATEEQCR